MYPIRFLVVILSGTACAASYKSTLEPRDTTCSTPSGKGTCISTSDCAGTSVAGYCPGASNIQCCVRTCNTPFGPGFCESTIYTCTGGAFVSGHCPGAADIQCCVSTCSTSAGNGSCLWTGSSCASSFIANKCPGPNDVQCCPSAGVKSPTVSPTISNPSSPQPTVNPSPTKATSNPTPPQDTNNPSPSQDTSNPSPSPDTGIPSHSETTGTASPSENAPSTPLGDANSSGFNPNFPGSIPSTTATSKTPTSTPKTPGTSKGGSDPPLSPAAAAGSSKHISPGVIAGIAIVGLIGLATIVGFITRFMLKKKRQAQGQQLRENSATELYAGSEMDGSGSASLQIPSQPPPVYAQELYSQPIYEMRGHKQ